MFNCPRCGAATTSGIYCQMCNDLLQHEVLLSVGEEADGFSVITWNIEENT